MSDDLHLNEIDCVRLLISANQEVDLRRLLFVTIFHWPIIYMWKVLRDSLFSLIVGLNGKRATRGFAPGSGALVHREKRYINSLIYAIKGIYSPTPTYHPKTSKLLLWPLVLMDLHTIAFAGRCS